MILAALTAVKAIPADEAKKIGAVLGAAVTADRIRRGVITKEEAELEKEVEQAIAPSSENNSPMENTGDTNS